MKRFFVSSIITGLLLGLGTAAAQTAAHGVVISIPNVLMLRLVDGSTASVIDPMVVFDFQAEIEDYLAAVDGTGILAPTSSNFSDVIVFSNRATWSVSVSASALTFTDNLLGGFVAGGLVMSDISVVRPDPLQLDPNVLLVAQTWDLVTAPSDVAVANGVPTQGWRSLGFGGGDYRLSVDGDENPGLYTTTVTYTIAAP